jgi:L-lactate dehydrogenase complex protein LldG
MEGAERRATMSAREQILGSIRRSLGVTGREAPRRKEVADRIAGRPRGVVPARGQGAPHEQVDLFVRMVEAAAGTIVRVADAADVPAEVADFLRRNNLPMAVRRGADARLAALPWERAGTLEVSTAPWDASALSSVSHAFGAVAETGTLVLLSGADNPTKLNFLPDNHIVVADANDIVGDYESIWPRLREKFGDGAMPRVVNLITGPSRSADIEQTLIMGAHGPRRLHVILLDAPRAQNPLPPTEGNTT